MKVIKVVAAVIESEQKVMVAQRSYGEFEGLWEFPGGKVEEGETKQEALVREIREEFDADIEVLDYLTTVEHDYSSFHLSMDCFICKLDTNSLHLYAHTAVNWINPDEEVDWVPADVKVIEAYRKRIANAKQCSC